MPRTLIEIFALNKFYKKHFPISTESKDFVITLTEKFCYVIIFRKQRIGVFFYGE